MSTSRRLPLSSNPNVANSPLRGASALQGAKKLRSHVEMLREESYGQPPPAKRQMVDHGIPRPIASPTRQRATRTIVHRDASRAAAGAHERSAQNAAYKPSEKDIDNIKQWQAQTRSRFPNHVFFFENIPDEQRSRLTKQLTQLGARTEQFFSINITHIVTTRPIPAEKSMSRDTASCAESHVASEQPKTIDPSLLNRNSDLLAGTSSVRRKLIFDTSSSRRIPIQASQEDAIKRPKVRSTDVLHRARDMGKKIWSLEKLQKILDMLLEQDPYKSAVMGHGRGTTHAKESQQSNLLQLLQNERVNGPSDRDPTVLTKEITYFKGPYIYVYDIEEKTKPIMVREYARVADKKDGDWPQFRVASQGRCPFVEDYEIPEKDNRAQSRTKTRVVKEAAEAAAPKLQPPEAPASKAVAGKRTLTEMEDGNNRGTTVVRATESFDRTKVSNIPSLDFRSQNAFMSHAKAGRFLAGEPVASGVQPNSVTSAIRSQMISSTTGALGAKAGTSKEIHGLQRKVLQKASTPAVSQDLSSRRMAEMSHDSNTFIRSASVSRATHRKLDVVEEDETVKQKEKLRRTVSAPQAKPKVRDPKPGYCENCQDKFDDFDDHIVSRKHRRFADNDANWTELDALLGHLERLPRPTYHDGEW
ncbi:Dfp1/Him1, central region-domain-containing protein [Apodospora peruviana]|uniref:Dfp1/Him1, central region-domain-containing protein n=1 Tax=Apodospora peruviana TaxID=516989 RepID=A0AAE0I257_9PEZI|nr:Dfp1/Him1, central region-domain-containing protein [Apodospora peruviana]